MRNLLTVFLLFVFSALAFGQSSPDPLFAAAYEAHGGGVIHTVQTLVIRGLSTRAGQNAEALVLSANLDGRLRLDYGPQTARRTEVSRPEGGFRVQQGKTTWKAGHSGAFAQLDWLSVLGIRHLANGIERTLQQPGTVAGRETERAKVVTGRDQFHYRRQVKDEAEVQFDKETGLVAAISRQQFADESLDLAFTLTTTFSDYRPVAGGLVLPFQIRRYVDGQLSETVTVDSIDINPAFEPEFFGR